MDPLNANLQVNLEKMARGGLDAAFFIVYVGQTPRNDANYAQAQADAQTKFAAIHRMADELYPSRIEIAYRADDVERIAGRGKLVAAIGIENGYVLGKSLEMLDRDYELGARYVTLVHDGDNDLARSARPKPDFGDGTVDTGVSELGAAGDRADEPSRHHGRRVARLEEDCARRDAPFARPRDRVAFGRRAACSRIRATWTTKRCARCATTAA